jgi:hypothetical protein
MVSRGNSWSRACWLLFLWIAWHTLAAEAVVDLKMRIFKDAGKDLGAPVPSLKVETASPSPSPNAAIAASTNIYTHAANGINLNVEATPPAPAPSSTNIRELTSYPDMVIVVESACLLSLFFIILLSLCILAVCNMCTKWKED